MSDRGFERLDVFKRAYRVSLEIHRASLDFPAVEQRALADQLRRATKSIPANLAEGHGRETASASTWRHHIAIAMGSADEVRVWLRYAHDLGYIDSRDWRRWRDAYQEIARMLKGLWNQSARADQSTGQGAASPRD